jgi:hypothetical protein
METSKENEFFFFNLLKYKSLKFEEIEGPLQIKITNFNFGSLLLIYESLILLCRKGNNNLSIMIPDIQLNNLSKYAFKYVKCN